MHEDPSPPITLLGLVVYSPKKLQPEVQMATAPVVGPVVASAIATVAHSFVVQQHYDSSDAIPTDGLAAGSSSKTNEKNQNPNLVNKSCSGVNSLGFSGGYGRISGINISEEDLSHPPGFSNKSMGYNMDGCFDRLKELVEDHVERQIQKWIVFQLTFKGRVVWIRDLGLKICNLHKINFLVIQETKMEAMDLVTVSSFRGNASFMHAFSSSRGSSGGILVVWDHTIISQKNVFTFTWFVVIEAIWVPSGLAVMFIVVYAPQGANDKRELWDQISRIIMSFFG
ncbi:unnamed protein product [Lactuca saligna]|uniref:RNA-directed DNA polymerase, eukaryota, reverse transcriptase zinc-binding domain protein n=1 Tax=Lactuca saligna TaxID=75948 RepID=A0AA35Z4F7_LACSI|nr:unnamed protein product [Lactuca saligna]